MSSIGVARAQINTGGSGGGGGGTGTLHYEVPLTGVLGVDAIYTFTHNIGALILNNATQDPNLDYSGQGTTTATFITPGFIPTGTSILNQYIA